MMPRIGFTNFSMRHFSASFAGTKCLGTSPDTMAREIGLAGEVTILPGYAPFCKHFFVKADALTGIITPGVAEITPLSLPYLRSGYKARREGELPVLTRWFEGLPSHLAPSNPYVDLVVYSREHLEKEGEFLPPEVDWGVVAVLSAPDLREPPINPETQVRNALGIPYGGSGVELDPLKYQEAVEYWSRWAPIGGA
jgi:hypothetical protein